MAYDFRANQVRLNRIISSGSVPILIYRSSSAADFAGNLSPTFNTSGIGTDVFLFISGSSNAKTLFGGDAITSGSFRSLSGITGSVRHINASGTPFIVGGSDIVVNYNTLGQWEISGSEASFFTSPSDKVIQTTGSLLAVGLSSSNGAQITGSLEVLGGITGSISGTVAGNPFLVAGPNVTLNYNTLGQWEVTSSGGPSLWTELDSTHIYTTSSAAMSHLSVSLGAEITGSFVQGLAGNVFATGLNAFAHGGFGGSGIGVEARGDYSHAEGGSTVTAVGAIFSHAEGSGSQAKAQAAHSEGEKTIASGTASHAEGYQTIASKLYAHAEGYQSVATGQGAHAEGNNTTASGDYSHSEGISTTASNLYAHAEGSSTTASGEASHAEGLSTQATGDHSHAQGNNTIAAGKYSFAGGTGTEAHKDNQTALGTYNIASNNTSLFVVGDGANSGARHDILRVETGNVQITGSLIVDSNYRITGSIHTVDGTNPYILGNGITVNYNSLGQYELTSSGGGGTTYSGSITVYGDGTNRGSGSISGLFDTTANRVGKYEVDIVAISFNNGNAAGWKFSTTTFSGSPSVFRFIGINELSEDLSSGASDWEVNFNDSGTLDVTGSTILNGTFFYARVTNKMVANFNTIIS